MICAFLDQTSSPAALKPPAHCHTLILCLLPPSLLLHTHIFNCFLLPFPLPFLLNCLLPSPPLPSPPFLAQLKVRPKDLQLCSDTSSGVDSSGHFQWGDLVQIE